MKLIIIVFLLACFAQYGCCYEHDKWNTKPKDHFKKFAAYVTSFDGSDDNDGDGQSDLWGIPEFVAYEIRKVDKLHKLEERPRWMTDEKLYKDGIAPADNTYAVSGTKKLKEVVTNYRFVRGHMCPKVTAERISKDAAYNTHTVLNACPQLQAQNNGIWKQLEIKCNIWANKYGQVWVICGPVFFNKKPAMWLGQAGEKQAAIPDAFFKVVIKQNDNKINTLAFIIPNNLVAPAKPLNKYLTTIKRIEALTGLTFLNNLSPEKQVKIKKRLVAGLWK